MLVPVNEMHMLRWRLREVMSRYKIKNSDLADATGRDASTVSRLKAPDRMPRLNGDDLSAICTALTKLIKEQGGHHVVTHIDLFEYVPDDDEVA